MSTDCVHCITNPRDGGDLLCSACRAEHEARRVPPTPRTDAAKAAAQQRYESVKQPNWPSYCLIDEGFTLAASFERDLATRADLTELNRLKSLLSRARICFDVLEGYMGSSWHEFWHDVGGDHTITEIRREF